MSHWLPSHMFSFYFTTLHWSNCWKKVLKMFCFAIKLFRKYVSTILELLSSKAESLLPYSNAPFLYSLKTSENGKIFWCFQGIEKGCIGNEWLKDFFSKCDQITLTEEILNEKLRFLCSGGYFITSFLLLRLLPLLLCQVLKVMKIMFVQATNKLIYICFDRLLSSQHSGKNSYKNRIKSNQSSAVFLVTNILQIW